MTPAPEGRRLRVLVLTDHYPPHITGGYDLACAAVTERLPALGCDTAVLTSVAGGAVDGQPHVARHLHRTEDSASLVQLASWEIADHRTLRRALSGWRPHIVSVWSLLHLFPSLHAVLAGAEVPVVYNLHDLWIPRHFASWGPRASAWAAPASSRLHGAAKAPLRAWLRRYAPHVVTPQPAETFRCAHGIFCSRFRMAQHEEAGVRAADMRVIYNGVDLRVFTGAGRTRPGGPLRLLFVGRSVEEKGLETLLRGLALALAAAPGRLTLTAVTLPGHPPAYHARMQQLVRDLALSGAVAFRAPVPHDGLPDLYTAHDVLVFPSLGPEGFPMVLLEAAACGCALVGSVTGGTGEFLVDGDTGVTFPPGDATALAACLLGLEQDRLLVDALASRARAQARQRFDLDRIAAETLAGYRDICRLPPAPVRAPGERAS